MDWQVVLNIISIVVVPVIGAVFFMLNRTRDDLQNLRVHLAEKYVHKDSFQQTMDAVFAKLDRIESKLDNKMDK